LPNGFRSRLGSSACNFVEDIIDGMQDWVRVIGKDDTVLFVNKSMRDALGYDVVGRKCYEVLGLSSPCRNCISKLKNINVPGYKEEIINGRIFSVTSSPLKNLQSENIEAVIEVLHDITDLKTMGLELESQNRQLREDLSIARRLQCSLLPKQQVIGEKIDFSYIYKPCETLGGDFLDIFRIDDEHTGIYIADVSGHGVAASMLTMFLRAALDKSMLSPAKALTQLYLDFNNNGFDDELYISVFYAIINTSDNSITYSNAGHNVCPIQYSGDSIKVLRSAGIPISNWVESPDYVDTRESLNSGDKLFFYTDGIIEIKNSKNEQFGEDRIIHHLIKSDLHPSSTLTKLIDKAMLFSGRKTHDIMDDITVALLEIK
jgi:sigma-B regulation protein RsbU (phosphoserine phosphatase)